MRRRMRRLETTALVDGHVHHHRSGFHLAQHLPRDEFRRLRAGNQHRTDHQIGVSELLADVVFRGHERLDVARHHVGQVGEPLQRNVADRHVGARSGGRAGRGHTDHAGSDDEDLGGFHARNAAQQHALAAARLLEEVASLLRGHAPRHLGHGNEQRQRTVGPFDRLVGAADRPAVDHRMSQRLATGEVEIGEDELPPADEPVLGSDRLLDLDDHLGRGVDLLDCGEDTGADRLVGAVGETAVLAGRSLHEDVVSPFDELLHAGGSEADAIFVVLDLFWNADNHNAGYFKGFSPSKIRILYRNAKKPNDFLPSGQKR